MSRKTVVFGLDGACFDLIDKWIESGRLDTINMLTRRGVSTELSSSTPATTPPAWSSLTTGVNPGKHGVFGFYKRHQDSYQATPVSDEDVRARRLWDYTSMHGKTALIINVPVTHPGRELDGAIVPGYLATDSPQTYPEDVLSSVGMDHYSVYAPSEAENVPEETLLNEWLSLTDSRRDLSLRLMDTYDWDLLFVEFQKTDGAVHKFENRDNIRRIFEQVDDCMSDILESTLGEPNVFVVSDHGIGQQKEWSIALNTWLIEQGYAKTTVGSDNKPSWQANAMDIDANQDTSAISRVLTTASALGVTKQNIERALAAVGLYEIAARLAPGNIATAVDEEIVDKSSSEAFYDNIGFSGVDVGVSINTADYYDDGIVDSSTYQALRKELIDRMKELRGPDGERAFASAAAREDVYDGPFVSEAPDIILTQSDNYVIGSSKPRGKTFIRADPGRIDHTDTGLLIAAGPDITPELQLEDVPSIHDVTPTLLHLLDVPLNERFDGEPLDLFTLERRPKWQTYEGPAPGSAADLTSAEEAALEERLKGMGYLE